MNPLDVHDPSKLFGPEALADVRALKKAYAKLIRQFGPENAPEAFQHIRHLYERQKSALERVEQPAAQAIDGAPPLESSAADDATGAGTRELPEADAQLVDVALATISEGSFDSLLERLRQQALRGNAAAAVARLAALQAIAPDEASAWILELANGQKLLACVLAHFLLRERPHEAANSRWSDLFDMLDGPRRYPLVAHRLQTLFDIGEREMAIDEFHRHEAEIRRLSPDVWLSLLPAYLSCSATRIADQRLAYYRREIDAVELALDVSQHIRLLEIIEVVTAVRAATADTRVSPPVLTAVTRGLYADPATTMSLLRCFVAEVGDLDQALNVVRHYYPSLYKALDDMRERVSGAGQCFREWTLAGAVPPAHTRVPRGSLELLEESVSLEYQLQALEAPRSWASDGVPPLLVLLAIPVLATTLGKEVAGEESGKRIVQHLLQRGGELGVVSSLLLVAGFLFLVVLALGCCLAVYLWFVSKARRQTEARRQDLERRRATMPLTGPPRSQVLQWLYYEGFFAHELAAMAAVGGGPALRSAVADLVTDEYCDYRVLSAAHLQRLLHRLAWTAQVGDDHE